MSEIHLLSYYGSDDDADGYARRQHSLHQSATANGGIKHQHPWSRERLQETDFYVENRAILDQPRGAGFWLWKPWLIRQTLADIPQGDFLLYHDVGRAIRRDPDVGYRFTRSVRPLADWAADHDGMFPGIWVPGYGPARCWTKRDCFVLMGCDEARYWDHPLLQAGINVWQNTARVREFIDEWLEHCLDPRILTDQPNTCGRDNLAEFRDHRHDQSVLTNLVIKGNIPVYGSPDQTVFRQRDIEFITTRLVVDELANKSPQSLTAIAADTGSYRKEKGYLPLYELMLEERRQAPLRLLEIRHQPDPDSAALWSRYLPLAEIHHLSPENDSQFDRGNNHHKLNPTHRASLERFRNHTLKSGIRFDVIIQRGTQLMRDQQLALGLLFPLLNPSGLFFIEGMAHCLRPGHGDLLKDASNATFRIIRQINVPQFPIDSLYLGLGELRYLTQYADTAGVHWTTDNKDGVAMIRHAPPPLDMAR